MAKVSFSKPGTNSLVPSPTDIPVEATATPVTAPEQPRTQTATTPSSPEVAAPATAAAPASPAPAAVMTVTPSPGVPAVIAPAGVPATTTSNPGFYDDENISAKDLTLPRYNIVQKVGELSNLFQGGAIVLGGALELAGAPKPNAESTPVRFLVVGLQPKKYVEKVEGGMRGNVFDMEEQVVKAGGTLDFNEAKLPGKTLYQTLITALILVERPANLDATAFPLEHAGKQYALALYSMKGTSYTNAAKHILTARKMGRCVKGFRYGWWSCTSKLKAYSGGNASFIPVLRPQEESTPELRAFLTELLGF